MSNENRENVLLFGLGGIGGVYACILALGGKCNVHVVARSNYDSVKEKGFRLKSSVFGDHDDVKFAGGELVCRVGWGRAGSVGARSAQYQTVRGADGGIKTILL